MLKKMSSPVFLILIIILLLGSCVTNPVTQTDVDNGKKPLTPWLSAIFMYIPGLGQLLHGEYVEAAVVAGSFFGGIVLGMGGMAENPDDVTAVNVIGITGMTAGILYNMSDVYVTSITRSRQYSNLTSESLNSRHIERPSFNPFRLLFFPFARSKSENDSKISGTGNLTVTFETGPVHGEDLIYKLNTGEKLDVPPVKKSSLGTVLFPPGPRAYTDKENYRLYGWFEDPYFTIPADFEKPITRDTTYYAQWAGREGDAWEYLETFEGIIITGALSLQFSIPDEIDGKPVTGIAAEAFENDSQLVSLTIPDSVQYIGESAFYRCEKLKSVTLPAGLVSIEDEAFMYCRNLEEITLPDGLASIGSGAFKNCLNLRLSSGRLPESLKEVGESVFYGCYKLTEELILPSSWEVIPEETFAGCNTVINVELPAGLKKIGEKAFFSCKSMKDINLPEGLNRIEDSAFRFCESLDALTIPESVYAIGEAAFARCESLEEIVLPPNLTSIEGFTFSECEALRSVELPPRLNTIGTEAFAGCIQLTEIQLPESLQKIEMMAFSACIRLGEIDLPERIAGLSLGAFSHCGSLERITFSENLTSIGMYAFLNCLSLTEIKLPAGITYIGGAAFENCEKLRLVEIHASKAPETGGTMDMIIEETSRIINSFGETGTAEPLSETKDTFFEIDPEAVLMYPAGGTGYDVYPWSEFPNRITF